MAEETKQQNTQARDKAEEGKASKEKKDQEGAAEIASDENREPKISVTEIVFITPFYLISDTIDISLLMVGLDDFGLMDLTRTSISQVYFVMFKKMGPEIWMTNLVINGIKLFPYIGSLVPSTLVWVITIFIDRGIMNKIKKIMDSKIGSALVNSKMGGKLVKGLEKAGKIK